MEYKLLITKEAENDIDEIVAYIVNVLKNPIAAENILTKIECSDMEKEILGKELRI